MRTFPAMDAMVLSKRGILHYGDSNPGSTHHGCSRTCPKSDENGPCKFMTLNEEVFGQVLSFRSFQLSLHFRLGYPSINPL